MEVEEVTVAAEVDMAVAEEVMAAGEGSGAEAADVSFHQPGSIWIHNISHRALH